MGGYAVNIAIRIEDGVVQEVTSDDPGAQGAKVAILLDHSAEQVVKVMPEDLSLVMRDAMDRTTCQGIGIACDEAAARIKKMALADYSDPAAMVDDIEAVIAEFAECIRRAATAPSELGLGGS